MEPFIGETDSHLLAFLYSVQIFCNHVHSHKLWYLIIFAVNNNSNARSYYQINWKSFLVPAAVLSVV